MLLKKATFYLAVAGTVATIIMVARLNRQSPITPPPLEPSPKPYQVSVAATGIVEALSDNVSIGVPEAGLVTKVHVKVWNSIKEGQPLFTLDDRELQAQLAVNEANITVAEATLRRLQDQLGRLKGVNDPRAVSQDEVRTRENDVLVAQAQLEAARAQVSLTGASTERVDTRVLQVIYSFERPQDRPVYVGQQVDLFVKSEIAAVAARVKPAKQLAQAKGIL